jgi:hypothetical protein
MVTVLVLDMAMASNMAIVGTVGMADMAVPAAIGGLIIYEATRQPVIVQPNPIIIQQQTLPFAQDNPSCTPWTEVHSSDGTISRTRTCTQ